MNSSAVQRVARTESRTAKAKTVNIDENVENSVQEQKRPALKTTATTTEVDQTPPVLRNGVPSSLKIKETNNLCSDSLQDSLRETIKEFEGVELRTKVPTSPVDKETARKSFLAAMLGAQEAAQEELERLSMEGKAHENSYEIHKKDIRLDTSSVRDKSVEPKSESVAAVNG